MREDIDYFLEQFEEHIWDALGHARGILIDNMNSEFNLNDEEWDLVFDSFTYFEDLLNVEEALKQVLRALRSDLESL